MHIIHTCTQYLNQETSSFFPSLYWTSQYLQSLSNLPFNLGAMFSSFSSFANPFNFLGRSSGSAIDLKSVDIHDIETKQDKRARTLKHLIKLNHANHSILYNHLQFHNHLPHVRRHLLKRLPCTLRLLCSRTDRYWARPTYWDQIRTTST